MSRIDYCRRGGQEGIVVTTSELNKFANFMKSNALDEFIPLPDTLGKIQREAIKNCTSHSNAQYWENNKTGGHGWCCRNCGTVVQWG